MKTQTRKNIKLTSVILSMPTSLHQAIKLLADKENKSRTFFMVEALAAHIDKKEKTQ